jgi:hypothetical protein
VCIEITSYTEIINNLRSQKSEPKHVDKHAMNYLHSGIQHSNIPDYESADIFRKKHFINIKNLISLENL